MIVLVRLRDHQAEQKTSESGMPRKSFFEEIRKRYISPECAANNHEDCELEVIIGDPMDYPIRHKPCGCICHEEWMSPPLKRKQSFIIRRRSIDK